jgi:hypothetical protein
MRDTEAVLGGDGGCRVREHAERYDVEDACMSAEAAYTRRDVCVHRPRGMTRE